MSKNDSVNNLCQEKVISDDCFPIFLNGAINKLVATYEESNSVVKDLSNEIKRLESSLNTLRLEKRNILKCITEEQNRCSDLNIQDEEIRKLIFEKVVLEKSCNDLLITEPSNSDILKLKNIKKKYKMYRNLLGVKWDSKKMTNKENVTLNILKNNKIKTISIETKDCPNIVDRMWEELEKSLDTDWSDIH